MAIVPMKGRSMNKTAEQIRTAAKTIVDATIAFVVARFLELKSTTFIQLWQVTNTISGMRKTGNRFYGRVSKTNCLNCVTNYTYENMVNKARSKESMSNLRIAMENAGVPIKKIDLFFSGAKRDITENAETFKSSGLPWGNYVDDSKCIIEHTPDIKGKSPFAGIKGKYLQVAIIHYSTPVYRWIESGIELTADELDDDGNVIKIGELTEMKTFIPPKKEGEKQGLAKPYIIRSPRFETIKSISLNKTNYRITE